MPHSESERRPLSSQRVVVTRSREQAAQLAHPLKERGAEVWEIPVIRIAAAAQAKPLQEVLAGLNAYDWIVFTSANGVNAFFTQFFQRFQDLRDFGGARIAAVGPGTAAKIKELHLEVEVMPEEHVAIKIAEAMSQYASLENLRILLLRAEVANPELPRRLEELGAIVDDIACYQTLPETEDVNGTAAKLVEQGADWITFTSGSTVKHFHARFNLPKLLDKYPHLKLASIGPETSKALAVLGLRPSIEAKPHTIEGMIKALERRGRRP